MNQSALPSKLLSRAFDDPFRDGFGALKVAGRAIVTIDPAPGMVRKAN